MARADVTLYRRLIPDRCIDDAAAEEKMHAFSPTRCAADALRVRGVLYIRIDPLRWPLNPQDQAP